MGLREYRLEGRCDAAAADFSIHVAPLKQHETRKPTSLCLRPRVHQERPPEDDNVGSSGHRRAPDMALRSRELSNAYRAAGRFGDSGGCGETLSKGKQVYNEKA